MKAEEKEREKEEERRLAELRGELDAKTHPVIKAFATMKQRDKQSIQGAYDAYQKNEERIAKEKEDKAYELKNRGKVQ